MTKAQKVEAAIAAGFWFSKLGVLYRIGRDSGSKIRFFDGVFTSKAKAREAMVAAWERETAREAKS